MSNVRHTNVGERAVLVGLILLLIIGLGLMLVLIDSTAPHFKHSLTAACIIAGVIAFICALFFAIYLWKIKLDVFQSFTKLRKVRDSFLHLIAFFIFVSSVEYLIYLNSHDEFNVSSQVGDNESDVKKEKLNKLIKDASVYESAYSSIHDKINPNAKYYVFFDKKDYLTLVENDTIIIHRSLYLGTAPMIGFRESGRREFSNARSCQISLKNDRNFLAHPASREIRNQLIDGDSVNGKSLKDLVERTVEHYQIQQKKYRNVLLESDRLSFGRFIGYCFSYNDIIGKDTSIYIRFLVIFEAFVMTFIVGYITQLLYKVLDGE